MAATGIKFLKGLNSATGLVSFSTLIGMLIRGNCKPSRSFQSYVHMMVYFDCAAFVVAFTVQFAEDSLSRCASEAFWLVASFFWSAKDAFKYGYLAFRCIRIMGFKSNIWNWAIHGAFTSSLVLYWLYMALSFNFSGTCADVSNGNVNFNWPVLLLYGWWLTMDLVMAVGMLCSLNRMSKEAKENRESLGKKDQHSPVIAQERIRLIINAIVMVILNLVSILNVTKTINVSANAIAFVYLQHWIALSSNPSSTLNMKGKNRTSSSLGSASTTTGGTASGKSRAKQQLGMLAAAHGANEMAEK